MANYATFLKELGKEQNVKIKVKGGDVGTPNCFNINLIIIKKALVNYLVAGKSVYDTINENQDLIDYQIIKKRSAKTKYVDVTNNIMLEDKVLRLFPVTKNGIQILTDKMSNIPDVPESTIIVKENIIGKKITDIPHFDINYYVKTFNDRLESWIGENTEDSEKGE